MHAGELRRLLEIARSFAPGQCSVFSWQFSVGENKLVGRLRGGELAVFGFQFSAGG